MVEGTTSDQTVSIANTGGADAEVKSASIQGSGLSLKGISLPLTIAGGESANFSVEFAPTSAGDVNGSLILTTTAQASPVTVSLTGKGTGATIAATPSSTSFGSVVVGDDATQEVQLKVSGTAGVKITKVSATGSGFSVSGLAVPMTLGAGDSANFIATFKPTNSGNQTGQISVTSTAENSQLTIDLTGTATSRVISLSVTPNSLSFGSVGVGKASSKQVALKNTGNANASISTVSVSGSGFSASGVTANSTLKPGDSLSMTVKFNPSKSGTSNGTVTVASNASNSPGKISLTGSGASSSNSGSSSGSGSSSNSGSSSTSGSPSSGSGSSSTSGSTSGSSGATQSNDATQHVVTLQWSASTTAGVVGYNVYRGTQTGIYTKISATVPGTSYSDSVTSGQNVTYFYVVTAVDSNGTESAFSDGVSVTIPNS